MGYEGYKILSTIYIYEKKDIPIFLLFFLIYV